MSSSRAFILATSRYWLIGDGEEKESLVTPCCGGVYFTPLSPRWKIIYISLVLAVILLRGSVMNGKWGTLIAMGNLHKGLAVECCIFGPERSKLSPFRD